MKNTNYMEVKFSALSVNEGFARVCVASFCLPLNPSVDEIGDIKTAVSEAVTNCVVHAYPNEEGLITLCCEIEDTDIKTLSATTNSIGIDLGVKEFAVDSNGIIYKNHKYLAKSLNKLKNPINSPLLFLKYITQNK